MFSEIPILSVLCVGEGALPPSLLCRYTNVTHRNIHHLHPRRFRHCGRRGVVCLSARPGEQVFLSGSSIVHLEWSLAGGDGGEKDAAGLKDRVIWRSGDRVIYPKPLIYGSFTRCRKSYEPNFIFKCVNASICENRDELNTAHGRDVQV